MAEFTPSKPDFNVMAMDKNNKDNKGQIGVAWKNVDGSIRIKLNAFTIIDTTKFDFGVMLFPITDRAPIKKKKDDSPPPSYGNDYDAFKDHY